MAYTNPIPTLVQYGSTGLQAFRDFVTATAKPQPYRRGYTEGKGVLNIAFGTSELAAFLLMKATGCLECSKHAPGQYDFATTTLSQGWQELDLRGKATTVAGGCKNLYERCRSSFTKAVANREELTCQFSIKCPRRAEAEAAARDLDNMKEPAEVFEGHEVPQEGRSAIEKWREELAFKKADRAKAEATARAPQNMKKPAEVGGKESKKSS